MIFPVKNDPQEVNLVGLTTLPNICCRGDGTITVYIRVCQSFEAADFTPNLINAHHPGSPHTFSGWLCPVDGYTAMNKYIFEFKLEFEEEHLILLERTWVLAGSGAHFDLSFQEKTQFEERVPVLFRLMHSTKSDKFCIICLKVREQPTRFTHVPCPQQRKLGVRLFIGVSAC